MKILESKEAIEYLQDLRSTIKPYVHTTIYPATLLGSMVDLKIRSLEKSRTSSNLQSKLLIGSHGFPDLLPWIVDTAGTFKEYELLKQERARCSLPFVQAFIEGSAGGLKEHKKKILKFISENREYFNMVGGISEWQVKDNLVKAAEYRDNQFPLTSDPQKPSVLLYGRYEFKDYGSRGKSRFKFRAEGALKYVQRSIDGNNARIPVLLAFNSNFDSILNFYRGSLPEQEETEMETIKLVSPCTLVKGNLIKLLAETDFTGLTDSDINNLFKAVYSANAILNKALNAWQSYVLKESGYKQDLSPEETGDLAAPIGEIANIYEPIQNPLLRLSLQTSIAEIIQPFKKSVEETAKIPSQALAVSTKGNFLTGIRRFLPGGQK